MNRQPGAERHADGLGAENQLPQQDFELPADASQQRETDHLEQKVLVHADKFYAEHLLSTVKSDELEASLTTAGTRVAFPLPA